MSKVRGGCSISPKGGTRGDFIRLLVCCKWTRGRRILGPPNTPFTPFPEAHMRRFAFPIAVTLILVVGCKTSGPLDPAVASTSLEATNRGILIGSGTSSIQNDTTPSAQSSGAPVEAAAGGIMMGSGT